MPRTTAAKILAALCGLIMGMGLLFLLALYFFTSMAYTRISELSSPDGKMIIYAFQSNQDGPGHAPYGQILALSHGATLTKPDDGYVFFAGYCKKPLQYAWQSNDRVSIRCIDGDLNRGLRTLASLMYGIKVDYLDQ